MRYKKGLALLLAVALTMSVAPQTGSLASASEVPSVQESVPESGAAGSDAAAGTDSEAPESGAAGSDAAAGTDSEAPESGAAGSDAAAGTDSEAPESGAAGFGSEAGETDAAAPVPGDSLSGEGSEGEVSVPDEKQDADGVPGDDEGISPMSLLPLKEVDARLELYEADRSKVTVGTILQRMRDTEGNLISVNPDSEITLACSGDDYRSYGRDETVDLSGLTGEEPEIRLIVGKGTQLDAEAVRYIVKVRFYAPSARESLTYTVHYYKDSSDTDGSSVGNSNYNEYGRIEGLDVPVTLVRYAGRKEDMSAGEFGLSIRSSIDSNYGGRFFGNDIQVSVYQMKTFLDAYNREERTIREDAPKEAILGSGSFRRGAYGELNQGNLIESDNLFCIVYTDTVTGKVVEYQGLAFIISSQEELFLKGNLYEEVDEEPICENLGGKLYTDISWDVNVSGEPGKGEVNYDQQRPSVVLPAGYPADKTYPYIIQNTDGMIKKVEVSDSRDSWGGTDITSDVLASGNTIPKGYGVKCGSPAYFTVYTAGGMVLRYCVSIRAATGSSTYSYTYQVSKEPNGAKEACIVGYGPDAVYEGTGIHVTPVMIYPKNTEGFDPKASYYLSMQYSGGASNKVAVYKMEDFLKCYDAGSGNVSGLDEGKAVTGQILGQNAVGYEGKYAESGSSGSNVFAIVYTSPYDGKVLGYHAISVQLAAKALAVEGGFYTDVDGKRTKVSSTSSTSFYSGYVGYSVHSGDEYKAIEGSYSPGTIYRNESLYEGYPYRQGDFFYIMEKNPDITKVEAGSGSQRENVTDKIFTEGYPAYDFQVTLGDGTEWNYSISRSGGGQNVIDMRYTYRVYAAGETPENQSALSLRKSEYTSYIPPEETELPVDVTQVILYLDPDKCGEGQEYGLSIQGGTSQLNSSNSQITREVYRMKDFLAYYQAKVGGTDAELEGKIDDILYQSGSANGHRGSYAAPSEGTDPTEADNMFCIVYRHKETREIMACQGLLIQIRPYMFDVKGTLYTVENGMSNPLPENAVTLSYNSPTQDNSALYSVVRTTGTAVSRYQSKGTYINSVQSVTYRYTMSQGYGADKYAYVMEVPGGDREKVRIFLGEYDSIEEAEAAGTENDITDAILPKDEASKPYGYVADYRNGVVVTAFVGADQAMQYRINVISNDRQVNWQYYIYARAAEGSSLTRVDDGNISKKVYIPYSLEGVDNIPVTKVMYYVSGENYKDAVAWSLRMSGSVYNIDTKVYRMKDYLEKKDDPETLKGVEIQSIINSSYYNTGHEGNYEDPGEDVLKADNLFCIVYTNTQTGEVVSRQGVLFVIHNQVSAPQAGGSIYQKEEGGALKALKEGEDYKLDSNAPAHDTSRPTWVIGGAASSYPKADSVSYTYTWASEESDIGEYRYVLDKNDDIDMVAEGAYETAEAARKEGKDITESILCKTEGLPEGYVLRHGEGSESPPVTNPFTVVFKDGSVLKITVTVQIQIIPSSSADDQAPHEYRKPKTYGDPYFRVTGAVAYTGDTNYVYQSGTQQGRQTVFPEEDGYVEKPGQVYVVQNSENTTLDAAYNYGYQTVFIADENADLTKIAPIFELGEGNNSNNVKAYVGRMQESGAKNSVHDFSEKSVLYNVFIGSSLRNYSVTFVKKTTGGANLFVNGPSTREVFLTETRERSHDILIANLGDAALTDLKVELRNAEHVKLDDYWTVGGDDNKELKAFDGAVSGSAYGELQNLAKIRLLPADGDGEVKGTLIISGKDASSGKEITKEITLTGLALNPEITTLSLDDAVKFVPYSYVIGTNNMHYEWNRVKFSVVEEPGADKWHKLPDGLELDEDTGEIYGLPQEDTPGEYHIKVKAEYSRTDLFEPSEVEFGLLVQKNEDQIVYEQSDSVASGAENDYTIITPVGLNRGGYRFDVTQIRDWNFDSNGPFLQFMDLYLNGEKLIEGTDYTADSGSTKIVVLSQTFEKARGENERNTLAAEFRVNGERKKSEVEVNTLYRTAQNFYLNLSDEEDPSESSAPTEEPGTETPEPGTTTPEPGTETPEPGTRPTATPEPGTRPTATPNPGTRPTATPEPGTRPTATPEPGTRPTATPNPGTRPTATPEPGTRPTATPNPGTRPTATPNPGTRPTATPEPGTRPTVTSEPGTRPTAIPNPGDRPGSTAVPAPGGRPGTTSAPGGQPGINPAPGDQGGTNPAPGGQGGANPAPGGQEGTNSASGGQPGTNPVPGGQGGTNPAPGSQPGTNPVPGDQGGTNPAPDGQPGTNQTPDGQDETQPGTESASGGQDAAASAPESPSDAGSSTEGGSDNVNTATIIARMADPEGNPYVGYTMEIHSEPKSAVLDQSGTATFADIEGGSHVMYVKDPKGNTAATKEFVLAVGDAVSLAGSQIAVKAGGTYTLSIQLEDDRLDFLSLEEGDTRNGQLSKARSGMNPFFWVVIAVLFLGVCGSGAWVYMKGKKPDKKNR